MADSSLKAKRLCELDYVLCAPPAYLESRRRPSHPRDIDEHRVVSYFSASNGKRFPLRFQNSEESNELLATAWVAVNESTAHLSALLAGLGIGQTFGFLARPHFKDGTLIELLPEWKPANHVLHLVYPADRFPNPKLRAFSDWAAGVFEGYDSRLARDVSRIIHTHG